MDICKSTSFTVAGLYYPHAPSIDILAITEPAAACHLLGGLRIASGVEFLLPQAVAPQLPPVAAVGAAKGGGFGPGGLAEGRGGAAAAAGVGDVRP